MQLIEPSLNLSEAKYIERLIVIYMDVNPSKVTNNSKLDINNVIHTLDDCLKDVPVEKVISQVEKNRNSIWREAPGSCYRYLKMKFLENNSHYFRWTQLEVISTWKITMKLTIHE